MRKLFAVAAVLAVTSAQAAEELKFGDVNYFIQPGNFNLQADVNQVYNKANVGGTVEEERGYILDTRLTYGVAEKLNVFLDLDYHYDMATEQAGASDTYADGLTDPSLGVLYRLANQNNAAYNIDLGAVAHVSVQDAEVGNPNNDGNAASGRNALELLAAMGRKWNIANEWRLTGGLIYNMDGEADVLGSNADVETDASTDVYLRAAYQYRPVNEFMMLVTLQATRLGDVEGQVGTIDFESDSRIDWAFGFTAKYLVLDNLIAKFNYGMSRLPDYDSSFTGAGDEVTARRANFWGLGLEYLF